MLPGSAGWSSPDVLEQHVRAARQPRVEQQNAQHGLLARPEMDHASLGRTDFHVPRHLKQHHALPIDKLPCGQGSGGQLRPHAGG
jgi:hypothetical protein